MGTNYYLLLNPCPHCGKADDRLHIGKSSVGWCFTLHVGYVSDKDYVSDLPDWEALFDRAGSAIEDEYGHPVTKGMMLSEIQDRECGGDAEWDKPPTPPYRDWLDVHRINYSEPGPNGLLRHRISRFCVGHGEGTWDLCEGEFE